MKDEFNLSEKECNILTKIERPLEYSIEEFEDKLKLGIIDQSSWKFEKGFFVEDVKEFIRRLKIMLLNEVGEQFFSRQEYNPNIILRKVDELAGDKLK
jgi:hypothetical protein